MDNFLFPGMQYEQLLRCLLCHQQGLTAENLLTITAWSCSASMGQTQKKRVRFPFSSTSLLPVPLFFCYTSSLTIFIFYILFGKFGNEVDTRVLP